MSATNIKSPKMTNYRWTIVALLFFATTINYLDRQVLSLLQPMLEQEFHWNDSDYGTITAVFSLCYAVSMIFAGKFIDRLGTKSGYAWAITIWSFGAIIHAFSGVLTEGFVGLPNSEALRQAARGSQLAASISMISVTSFTFARCVLAVGEAGNFPAAIKTTAEYFPKKDRAFATGIFNSGANVGAILAPLTVPVMAELWGWESAFVIIGVIGFIWLAFWIKFYQEPHNNPNVNRAEKDYILQDQEIEGNTPSDEDHKTPISLKQLFRYRQTWSFILGKFLTDGVWWFFLFWTPAYMKAQYNMEGANIALPIAILYSITVIGSIAGGKFPTYFINKGMDPYAGRMKAMFIIALFPLVVLLAQPLGYYSYWFPIVLIGIGGAAHQAWSANIFSTSSDMFPKKTLATITGIGGMAGGLSSFLINKTSGLLFTFADETQMTFMGFQGKPAGYFIIFIFCSIAYILGWMCMKTLVPKYQLITQ